MPRKTPPAGEKRGRLTFLSEAPPVIASNGQRVSRGLFACECGATVEVAIWLWRRGDTRSCGCLHTEIRKAMLRTHGQGGTPLHLAWASMRRRCTVTVSKRFPTYEGVTCDPRWETFEGFVANPPGGQFAPGMTLARFNDVGPYSPENTRWLTKAENVREMNERRMLRLADGRFARDVASANGIHPQAWRSRYYRGMSLKEAVTKPTVHAATD